MFGKKPTTQIAAETHQCKAKVASPSWLLCDITGSRPSSHGAVAYGYAALEAKDGHKGEFTSVYYYADPIF